VTLEFWYAVTLPPFARVPPHGRVQAVDAQIVPFHNVPAPQVAEKVAFPSVEESRPCPPWWVSDTGHEPYGKSKAKFALSPLVTGVPLYITSTRFTAFEVFQITEREQVLDPTPIVHDPPLIDPDGGLRHSDCSVL
jgi:hypothetical protein